MISANRFFTAGKDYTDVVYRTEEAKVRAITQEIIFYHSQGRPILVGTTSVEHSERLSLRLQAENIRRLAQTMIIRQAWMEKNNVEVLEKPVEELQQFNGALDAISAGDLRPTARNLGISLNPEDPANLPRLQKVLGLSEEYTASLLRILQAGIPHEVLNARKHDEESQIIAPRRCFRLGHHCYQYGRSWGGYQTGRGFARADFERHQPCPWPYRGRPL